MKGLVREIVLTNMLINKARRAVEGVVVVAATFERHLVSGNCDVCLPAF